MTNDASGATVRLSYIKIRDVTTKDEEANGASTYVAVLPAPRILKIGTDDNLRTYIPAHEGKKRNLVHKAIARTIREEFRPVLPTELGLSDWCFEDHCRRQQEDRHAEARFGEQRRAVPGRDQALYGRVRRERRGTHRLRHSL